MPRTTIRGFFMKEETQTAMMRKGNPGKRVALIVISIIIAVLFWYFFSKLLDLPAFILPGPNLVWQRF
ncbi:MAG: hypothetical protein ACK2TV_07520, partial [Anaerolineales bacterium]